MNLHLVVHSNKTHKLLPQLQDGACVTSGMNEGVVKTMTVSGLTDDLCVLNVNGSDFVLGSSNVFSLTPFAVCNGVVEGGGLDERRFRSMTERGMIWCRAANGNTIKIHRIQLWSWNSQIYEQGVRTAALNSN